MATPIARVIKRLSGPGLVFALCAGLAACGSSSSGSSTQAAASGSAGGPNAAQLTKAQVAAAGCMRRQGIDIPDPTSGSGSVLKILRVLGSYPSSKVRSAEQACAAQIRQALPNASSLAPGERAKRLQEADVFSRCMRSRGIAYPDPSTLTSDPSAYYRAVGSLDLNSPAVKSAGLACRAVMLKDTGG